MEYKRPKVEAVTVNMRDKSCRQLNAHDVIKCHRDASYFTLIEETSILIRTRKKETRAINVSRMSLVIYDVFLIDIRRLALSARHCY